MKLRINGEDRDIDNIGTVLGVLESFGLNVRLVVIEHNGQIIPRESYGEAQLNAGDNLEIVQMMAGG